MTAKRPATDRATVQIDVSPDAVKDAVARHTEALAAEVGADQDARNAIIAAKAKLDSARKAEKRAKLAFERAVAEAVSSEPLRVTWYDSPGYLTREQACKAAGISPLALDALMARTRHK